jgi:hypothetical protein
MSFFARGIHGVVCLAGVALLVAGCSEGGKPTAPVSGKVTLDGEAVTSGVLTFSPVASGAEAGKGASGVIQSDGSYTLTTYAAGDGAVIGTHRVLYTASGGASSEEDTASADASDSEHDEGPPASPYAGLTPKVSEVEVKAGGNEIDIELVPMKK